MNSTFCSLSTKYLEYIEFKKKIQTVRTEKIIFRSILLPYFKNKKVKKISVSDYYTFQQEIEKKNYSDNYKNNIHITMNNFLNWCIMFGKVKKNVAAIVGNFKNETVSKKSDVWSIEEFNKFINVIDDQVYKTLFTFFFFSGCRIGEVLALKFSDVHGSIISINKTISKERLKDGERVINKPKTKGSIRDIQIDNYLVKQLEELKNLYMNKYKNFDESFFVFGGIKPLANNTVTKRKNKYCKLANVKQIRMQDFRHSHATLLLNNNIPIQDVSKRLGHSNISITIDTYYHVIPEHEKRVINTLNSLHLKM